MYVVLWILNSGLYLLKIFRIGFSLVSIFHVHLKVNLKLRTVQLYVLCIIKDREDEGRTTLGRMVPDEGSTTLWWYGTMAVRPCDGGSVGGGNTRGSSPSLPHCTVVTRSVNSTAGD